ncbi:serine protease inhibitor 3/4-like [Cimex lectularius]|uniref:Serpin domain-containing protein n=1 Tax=Cimex lectularius TaxID=79782 RepID=A0A8I6RSQ7_CIMLE|nr:serine protease inhibitor 3/4-like [Cimex lectularius]
MNAGMIVLLGCVFYSTAQHQSITFLASFNNRMVPHLLQALSYNQSNVVYSPFGLATSLAVVFEGVDDKIATELCKILGLSSPKATRENLRLGIKILLEHMQAIQRKNTDGVVISLNSAKVHAPDSLFQPYAQLLKNYYKTEMLENITANATELVLDYFTDTRVMSHWKDFDKLAVYTYLTHQPSVPFMTPYGDVVNVPMVPQVGLFKAGYHPKLNSQIVELPLEDDATSLVLIMPDHKDGMEDVLLKMLEVDLRTLVKRLPTSEVEVTLPQFALVNSGLNIGKILKKSGLGIAFTRATTKNKRGSSRRRTTTGLLKSIKQNAYFATSFTSVNSVASTGSTLYRKVKGEAKKSETKKPQPAPTLNIDALDIENLTKLLEKLEAGKQNVKNEQQTEYSFQNEQTRRKRETVQSYSFNKPFIFLIYHIKSSVILLAGTVTRPT